MTISLPHLWIFGHITAVAGFVLVLMHLALRDRQLLLASSIGGALGCAALLGMLLIIGKSFFGIYSVLAWLVAFLAGYAVATPVGYVIKHILRSRAARPS